MKHTLRKSVGNMEAQLVEVTDPPFPLNKVLLGSFIP